MIISKERQLAQALLALEPPKVLGGSPPRQAWLAVVLDALIYLHQQGLDTAAFREEIIDDVSG